MPNSTPRKNNDVWVALISGLALVAVAIIPTINPKPHVEEITFNGVVKDSTDRGVPGAHVTGIPDNKPSEETLTDSNGFFSIPLSGDSKKLTLKIEATGFLHRTISDVDPHASWRKEIWLTSQLTDAQSQSKGGVPSELRVPPAEPATNVKVIPAEKLELVPKPFFLSDSGVILGTPHVYGGWNRSGAYWSGSHVVLNGVVKDHSFGLAPFASEDSRVNFAIPPNASFFSSTVALAGEVPGTCDRGEVRASVMINDTDIKWTRFLVGAAWKKSGSSPIDSGPSSISTSDIRISGGDKIISLLTSPSGDYANMDDCLVWIEPHFR